ncbi:MAG: aromatic ring-hydroxylating dioxygenase subunit alpha [Rhodospirillaceae bacterium]|nr:aromatic ring-hydroxylating dioxygenase subunit alpha [Rhodospirillaceae bacterium]
MLTKNDVQDLFQPTTSATGLPAFAYTCEDFAREEQAHLFARTWTCAGYGHEVPNPGDVMPRVVAGVPIVFTRTKSGEVKCFHNICTHRGTVLVASQASGQQALRCRYHGWTFDLDGNLRVTPHWGGHNEPSSDDLDKSCLGLKQVRMHQWHDWLFINVDGKAEPFETYAASFLGHCEEYGLDDATWCRTMPYEISGNWKLVAENYLETLHLNFVHTVSAEVAPFEQHEVIADGPCLGTIIDVGLPDSWVPDDPLPRWPGIGDNNRTAKNLALFPNFKFVIGPDHCCSMVEYAVGAGISHQRWDFYFHGDSATTEKYTDARNSIIDFYDKTNVEDFEAVQAIHEGHKSPAMTGARFNGIWEGGVHHFQKLVAEYMTA